jgi:DNA-binding XRE family transcriptional regulator
VVNTDKLRGILAERGISQSNMAKSLGMTPKTFYYKMSKKVFDSDEIEAMIKNLNIPKEQWGIFFDQSVTY